MERTARSSSPRSSPSSIRSIPATISEKTDVDTTHRDILILNIQFIYAHTTNVVELQRQLVEKGVIAESDISGLLDCKIYNIVSFVIQGSNESYKIFLQCLRLTRNHHVARRLEQTVVPKKPIISVPKADTNSSTQITQDDVLELTDIFTDSVIPYEELDAFLYEQHIHPEIYLHRKITQKTDRSEHWRLRKILKLWVSTYPWLATFEVLLNQLELKGYESTAVKVKALLLEVKAEIGTERTRFTGVGRRRGSSVIVSETGYDKAGEILQSVIKSQQNNDDNTNGGAKRRRNKIVQFALSLSKVRRNDKLDKLSSVYSDRSLAFKFIAIFATMLDVVCDFKFIIDCYYKGHTVWWVLSSVHLVFSTVWLQIIAFRYRKVAQTIQTHLGLMNVNVNLNAKVVTPRPTSGTSMSPLLSGDGSSGADEDDDNDSPPIGVISIKSDSHRLDTKNNAAVLSFPDSKSLMYRLIIWFPLLWPCPSAILHLLWIFTYRNLKRCRKPDHYTYNKDQVLTIYGRLVYLFYDSSHAGKMSNYEYFLETLPQIVFRTVYFLNMLMEKGADQTSETDFWSCASLALQLIFLGVTLTLFKVAKIQYCHFEDMRTFQLEYPWKDQALSMLSSGLSTGSFVLAVSVFFKMLFDSLSYTEWVLILMAVVFYILTYVGMRQPIFHRTMFRKPVRQIFARTSEFLSPVHLYPNSVADHFMNRCAFLLTLLVVSVLTGPQNEDDKFWPILLLAISLMTYIVGGLVQWFERPGLAKPIEDDKLKYN